ncbi:MAG: hypothetical protein EOM63_07525, partial [Clostridia bacterium]|nr:hypothetical protein [Clostridia bacterium]
MRSDEVTKNAERAPHRSLFKAMGYTDEELSRPLIGIANPKNEIVPGHFHLDQIAEAVKAGTEEPCKECDATGKVACRNCVRNPGKCPNCGGT